MSSFVETSLIIKKETLYDKIRKNIMIFIYQKDYETIQRLENFMQPRKKDKNAKIVIPKEIGKNIIKY